MQKAFITLLQFLVKCTLLYDPLCLSVHLLVSLSVGCFVTPSFFFAGLHQFKSFYILFFSRSLCRPSLACSALLKGLLNHFAHSLVGNAWRGSL